MLTRADLVEAEEIGAISFTMSGKVRSLLERVEELELAWGRAINLYPDLENISPLQEHREDATDWRFLTPIGRKDLGGEAW